MCSCGSQVFIIVHLLDSFGYQCIRNINRTIGLANPRAIALIEKLLLCIVSQMYPGTGNAKGFKAIPGRRKYLIIPVAKKIPALNQRICNNLCGITFFDVFLVISTTSVLHFSGKSSLNVTQFTSIFWASGKAPLKTTLCLHVSHAISSCVKYS